MDRDRFLKRIEELREDVSWSFEPGPATMRAYVALGEAADALRNAQFVRVLKDRVECDHD